MLSDTLRSEGKEKGGLTASLPSFFDILLTGVLGVVFIPDSFRKGIFFVYYTIFLFVVSTYLKPKRHYRSLPLTLFVLWALLTVFPHNMTDFVGIPKSIVNYYFNVSIMFEGFVFILCGFILLKLIVEYSKNPKFLFAVIPLVFLQRMYENYICLKQDSQGGRITIIAAIAVAVIVYLYKSRRYLASVIGAYFGLIVVILNWQFIMLKFNCRPYTWFQLIKDMIAHPVVGTGFNKTLFPDNMINVFQFNGVEYGWIWRCNDFLSIGAYLGVMAFIFISWWTIQVLKQVGGTIYLIPVLAIILTCSFQMTMFTPDKGALGILLIGISIKETLKGGCNA